MSVIPHQHHLGVFVARGKEDALVTLNLDPGKRVYGEKRILVVDPNSVSNEKIEYRVWNPFRSKLGSAIMCGIEHIYIKPGTKLLYLGAASGTTVSHCSDVVGPTGLVYAVEFSHNSGRDLLAVAQRRSNIVPIIEDARTPAKYRLLCGMVDVVFSDVAQPDQTKIVCVNAQHYLKAGGHLVMSIKASCIDSTKESSIVFAEEIEKLQQDHFKPVEKLSLEPFERDHMMVTAVYRPSKKNKD